MMADWQEFQGGEYKERYVRPRVTLSKSCEIYFGKKAYEILGNPEAVKLFFDVSRSCIGVKKVDPGPKTFEVVRRGGGQHGRSRASTFCRHYGIKPEARIEFQDVHVDADGIMVLDLKTARRLRK